MKINTIMVSLVTAAVLFTACGGGGGSGGDSGGGGGTTTKPVLISPTTFKVLAGQRKFVTLSTGEPLRTNDGSTYTFSFVDKKGASVRFSTGNEGVLEYTAPNGFTGTQEVDILISKNGVDSDIITLTFEAAEKSSAPVIKIHKTGQTVGDAGEDRSFTKDGTNFNVTDNVSGLEWADENHLINVNDRVSYTEAFNNCKAIGDKWRLPTIDELLDLIDYNKSYRTSMLSDEFRTKLDWSWAEKVDGKNIYAYNQGGIPGNDQNIDTLQYRCVNGDKLETDHLIFVDTLGDTYDLSTGLEWSLARQTGDNDGNFFFTEADAYCSALTNSRGQSNWRLPTINELRSFTESGGVPASITGLKFELISSTRTSDTVDGVTTNFNYGLQFDWARSKPLVSLFPQDGPTPQRVGASCVREYTDAEVNTILGL